MAIKKTFNQRVGTKIPRTDLEWLDGEHPIYTAWKDRWALNEQRLSGGDDVIDELVPFEWEVLRGVGSNFYGRQQQCIYPNFANGFLTELTGHLLKFAPRPDAGLNFGTLGPVSREKGGSNPTRAEQVFYSVDSPGLQGTPWDNWWADVEKRAGATGHRWIYTETASNQPYSVADERAGMRPYLCEYSPLDVPLWGFSLDGKLNFAVVRFMDEEEQLTRDNLLLRGQSLSTKRRNYLVLVREGFTGLGVPFNLGGWWKFDADKNDYDYGDFEDCGGEIPFFPIFYERSNGSRRIPAMSRPGITELGSAGIAYMNLLSSANFDAWDAGKSIEWLQGVDATGYDLAVQKRTQGSRWIPLPPNEDTDAVPQVNHGESGAVAHDVFTQRLTGIEQAAMMLGLSEATGLVGDNTNVNTHTGASKNASWSERQVPRIILVATNLGVAQNTAIYWLERRWGSKNPSGQANWPQKIDLIELVEKLQSFFEVERIAGIRSATVDAKAMRMVAEQKGLISSDGEAQTVEREYKRSAILRDKAEAQALVNGNKPNTGQPRSAGPGTGSGKPQNSKTAKKQADRLAKEKAGKGGPKQNPGGTSA